MARAKTKTRTKAKPKAKPKTRPKSKPAAKAKSAPTTRSKARTKSAEKVERAPRAPRVLEGQVGFIIDGHERRRDKHVFALRGLVDELRYEVTLELASKLKPGRFVYQGPALKLRRKGEASDALVAAFARKLALKPKRSSFRAEVAPFELFTLEGDATKVLERPVRFKGFLDGGDTEFYLELSVPRRIAIMQPVREEGHMRRFLDALSE